MTRILKSLGSVTFVWAAWQVLNHLAALEIPRFQAGPEGLNLALEWSPQSSEHHYRLGILHRDSAARQDREKARYHLEKATDLNPYRWSFWLELARCYELEGELNDARHAYREAIRLNAPSHQYRWRWANFLLRLGEREQALEEIGATIRENPELRPPALTLLKKLGADPETLWKRWPSDRGARDFLLSHLLEQSEAGWDRWASLVPRVWESLIQSEPPVSTEQGNSYVGHLLKNGEVESARREWLRFKQRRNEQDSSYRSGRNILWNGDFDLPLEGGVFGWQFRSTDDYRVEQDRQTEGTSSLRISFPGVENIRVNTLQQSLAACPDHEYRLTFLAESQNLTSDQGLFFEIRDQEDTLLFESAQIRGSTPLQEFEYSFRTGPATQFISIRLLRQESHRINNKLGGTLRLDSLRLEPRGKQCVGGLLD